MNVTAPLEATDFVIFGGTGDLALRKLLPALLLRLRDGQLPTRTRVVAVSRAGLDDAGYRDKVRGALPEFVPGVTSGEIDDFAARLEHVCLDVDEPDDWHALGDRLRERANPVRVFYLAVGPALFGTICHRLDEIGLVQPSSRVVLEKPLGHDLASAREINDSVGEVFAESQIFRIDHYLGKESVQNLLVTRFANSVFEPLWHATAIDHVQITVAESVGVGSRGGYYDSAGAMRDMLQNHLLQLLCLVAMEPPTQVAGESVRDEKLKVLQALTPLEDLDGACVLGQYTAGLVDGAAAPSYVEEVEAPSRTETFVALRAEVRNWRWAGVPFYLRTGKRMRERCSEIVVAFKPTPHPMFPGSEGTQEPNRLVMRLQPDESVRLHLVAKEPGPGGIRVRPVSLDLNFSQAFGAPSPDAYERLLMDVVRGNTTLFMRRDEIEAAWRWVEPIIRGVGARRPRPYAAGTDGPAAADLLIERDGRSWNEDVTR
ncbi:glucose-6-phosphate dehydrogenase [Janibacter sp. G349]|jgi:glucose-6-phosphate 1-dehydrogenase|uniref:glucose-6-phosphate dehydrogenase n=1 Tax=Janibacter TaxID=53457 RepID=UPI001FA42FC3|nr:glucose-6-phosphate dehydrogenase [Janibacter sp. CX7]UTT67539.1 glucose-6-phosphate dehydrogenase [Janibacter sp. CX7]HIZ98478.1 glucose-6-phosphate dehydrogenase [Candidatus Janibacter merdipullorum]